eukprot:CAMPEP_0172414232 /NCGR_PEP_ID=MMETSP1064-20121228/913_1 /TAXON_ID=202472 /ORGANISM="Aulacoseira subarctica , Strain CCAP 1002/5" /LENGTH=598 /DNA_ID=CAMNT_0013150805 /DNA_START=32 /DNA_END=1828 /DNA_ORIENTATION=-
MPHLITSPLVSPSDKSRCASVGNKKRSSTDPSQGASLATIISPEKEKGSAEAERGRDDRELAAMQTMLELPNMPPSPQSNTNAVSSDSAHMRNETPPPTSGHVCYDARPSSFVPFRSSRGRGMTHYAGPTPAPRAPPYSPHPLRGNIMYSPHRSPFMEVRPHGLHVSQRGGGHSSRYRDSQRHPSYDGRPYYYEREFYPHHPYHYPQDAPGPRRPSEAENQEGVMEVEQQEPTHASGPYSAGEETKEEGRNSKNLLPNKPILRKKILYSDGPHYPPHPRYFTFGSYPPPPSYLRHPLHSQILLHGHPLQPLAGPLSRHPIRSNLPVEDQVSAYEDSVGLTNSYNKRSQPNGNAILLPTPLSVSSLETCIPLKGPIPSKFWGDIHKFKDASVPVFDQLVNFPDHLQKHQLSKPINTSSGNLGMSALYRHCVMCGTRCISTASAFTSEAAEAMVVLKDESSSADGSSHTNKNDTGSSIIPRQNKGICTKCDVTVWVINASGLQIKWCKGCKNFRPWAAFGEKGGATKCMKCRERQKEKYASQKSRSEEPTKKRKIDDSIEVDSTESKIIMISDEINNRKLVTEQREDNENEEDDPNQLQW